MRTSYHFDAKRLVFPVQMTRFGEILVSQYVTGFARQTPRVNRPISRNLGFAKLWRVEKMHRVNKPSGVKEGEYSYYFKHRK